MIRVPLSPGQSWWMLHTLASLREYKSVVEFGAKSLCILSCHLPGKHMHARIPCPSPSPRVSSNSCPLSWWCHPTLLSSVAPFSCPQSFPASGSFLMSHLLTSGGQSIGVSASAWVLPVNIQGWFPLGLTSLISLLSEVLPRVSFSITVWNDQFFSTQPSLWSNSHMHTCLLAKP